MSIEVVISGKKNVCTNGGLENLVVVINFILVILSFMTFNVDP